MIIYFLGGGAGGLPLLRSPKQSHYCGSVGSVRGTLVLIVFFHFLAWFNKEFAVSGLVVVFNFRVLALGSVVEQPIERGMLLSKWATN